MAYHTTRRMLHTISTPLKPNEIFDDEPAASQRIRYATASDAILARLSLTEHVPPNIMDLVISAVRDPLFDSKELSLKSSADIYLQTANSRMQDAASLDNRSGYPPITFPQDVLVNIIDILKAEVLSAYFKLTTSEYQLRGELWKNLVREEGTALHVARATLAACSVVHSSWFVVFRRALGSIMLFHPEDALHDAIRHPCFGDWTTEMCLSLNDDHHPQHIAPILSRLPNIRFLKLDLLKLRSGKHAKSIAVALCDAIRSLLHLREYVISDINSNTRTAADLNSFTLFNSASLEVVRFIGLPVRQYASSNLVHFSHLRSLSSLKHIHIHCTDMERSARMPFTEVPMFHVAWTRSLATDAFVLDTVGSYASQKVPGPLQLDDLPLQLSVAEEQVYSNCRQLTIDAKHGCDIGSYINVFRASVSITALRIRLDAVEYLLQFGFVLAMCSELAELHISFPYSGGPRDFAEADEQMFRLMSDAGQKLKTLKAHFFCKRGNSYHERFLNSLFPNSQDLCAGRGIAFDITLNGGLNMLSPRKFQCLIFGLQISLNRLIETLMSMLTFHLVHRSFVKFCITISASHITIITLYLRMVFEG